MTRFNSSASRGRRAWPLLLVALLSACASQAPTRSEPVHKVGAAAAAPRGDADRGDPQARFDAALQLMKEGRRDEALNALLVLTADFPKLSGPLTDLGIVYAQQRKPAQAIDAFNRAVQANPNNVVALNALGVLYRERGDFARAEQSYQRALAIKPDYAEAHYNLAILYDVAMRRPEQALTHYRRYQELAGLDDKPMVAVWIRDLEPHGAASGGVVAGAQR